MAGCGTRRGITAGRSRVGRGETKMENLITQNKEAVQNGTIDEEQISSILSKQSALMGASLAKSISGTECRRKDNSTADETYKCCNYGYCR